MARSMLSPGTLFERASRRAVRSRGLPLVSAPPRRAATVISLRIFENILPRRRSVVAFLCLIVLHLLWPDMGLGFYTGAVNLSKIRRLDAVPIDSSGREC